jgi:cytochrome c
MNFEFNKVAGAILGTGLGVMAVGIIAEFIYTPAHPEKPGYVIAVAGGEGGGAAAGGAGAGGAGGGQPEVQPIAVRLQAANVDEGKSQSRKCQSCHTLGKGEPRKIGPNLWNVVGSPIIHPEANFDYSDAFKKKGEAGFTWTFQNLDEFIASPRQDIPGTAMSFAGLKDPQQRADVIAYLRTLSDNPVPLPEPAAAAPAGGDSGANAAPAGSPDQPAAPADGGGNAAPADGANSPPAAESPAAGSQN